MSLLMTPEILHTIIGGVGLVLGWWIRHTQAPSPAAPVTPAAPGLPGVPAVPAATPGVHPLRDLLRKLLADKALTDGLLDDVKQQLATAKPLV